MASLEITSGVAVFAFVCDSTARGFIRAGAIIWMVRQLAPYLMTSWSSGAIPIVSRSSVVAAGTASLPAYVTWIRRPDWTWLWITSAFPVGKSAFESSW